ncbi:MAG: hypothetical protein VW270_09890 [Candidatus Poseidoniales archaeon]
MSERVTSIDVMQAMDKAVDTMKAYHEVNEPNESAIHWIRINGFLKGILIDLFWEADQKKRKLLIENFDKETQEYLHKLTLESLRAKNVQAA